MKQGQVIGQVFIFLIGAFVIGAVLLLGYRGISAVNEQRCAAQESAFVTDLERALTQNLARGRVRTVQIELPCGATEIAFVSRSVVDQHGDGTTWASTAPSTIVSSVNSGDNTNVFILGSAGWEPVQQFALGAPIANTPQSSGNNFVIIPGAIVELRLEGDGQLVAVSPVQ